MPEIVLLPRILMEEPEPGSPLTELTITFDALAAKEFIIKASPERVISAGVTETLVDPCLSRLVSKPSAVTEIVFKPIASIASAKF